MITPTTETELYGRISFLKSELKQRTAERDAALDMLENYRNRVMWFLDAMKNESIQTADLEKSRGLDPLQREQFQHAVKMIKDAFATHNYLKEIERKTK